MANSKYLLMPYKKGGQIVPIILMQKKELISQYVSGRSNNIIESLFNAFPHLKENLLSSVNEICYKFESALEKVKKKLPGHGKCFCVGEDIYLKT